MKKQIATMVFLTLSTISNAQTWQWARQMGGDGYDVANSVCTDASGNIYVSGGLYDGPDGYFGNDTLSYFDANGIFITKMDPDGNFIWSRKANGFDPANPANTGADVIHYDAATNALWVSGFMSGSNQFIDTCTLSANGIPGENDQFLAKLDPSGNCLWNTQFDINLHLWSLASGGQGEMYGIINSWGGTFNDQFLTPGTYLFKFDAVDFLVYWIKRIIPEAYSLSRSLEYLDGHLYIQGGASDTLILDGTTVLLNWADAFVSKFDTTGSLQWVRTMGGDGLDKGTGVGTDVNGNVYVSGTFENIAQFGDSTLTAVNGEDWFTAKYDNDGVILWVRQGHVTGEVSSFTPRMTTDDLGNTYATGAFDGSIDFGACTITANSGTDGFIVKYDSEGNCAGARTYAISPNNEVSYPSVDGAGGVYVVGGFDDTTDFDGIQLTSYGDDDVFVAKIDLVTSVPAARLGEDTGLLIYANPNSGKCTINVPDGLRNERNLILRIFDSSGKLIRQTPLAMNEGRIQLSLEQEAKGIYTATLGNGEKTYSGRIVFE